MEKKVQKSLRNYKTLRNYKIIFPFEARKAIQ